MLLSKTWVEALRALPANDVARAHEFFSLFFENPAHPGISLERLHNNNFWSGRISGDLRAILAKQGEDWCLLYAGRHDDAYRWAERRRVEQNARTGSLQVVETVERTEIRVRAVDGLLAEHTDDYLLSLGVPGDWLPVLRNVVNEDQLLDLLPRLPDEVGEALLTLASGELVAPPAPAPGVGKIWQHQDTQRRFYVVEDAADLQRLLNAPLHQWVAFLHPSQQKLANGSFNGPVKITGSAGTGKTVVALHRARYLARQGKKVLLTTYVNTLAENLVHALELLCSPEELARIKVGTVHGEATTLVQKVQPQLHGVTQDEIRKRLEQFQMETGGSFTLDFLQAEWEKVVSPQGIRAWEEYRGARRTGRGRAISVVERKTLWKAFQPLVDSLSRDQLEDFSGMCRRACELLESGQVVSPYDAVVVDEVQDLQAQELRLVARLAGSGPNSLMLVGDAGQRIYAGVTSLSALGIPTRGRSHVLRINYRTTEQIRRFADSILGDQVDDLDEGTESRKGTRSLLKGPAPNVHGFASPQEQEAFLVARIAGCLSEGLAPEEIALFARTNRQLEDLDERLRTAGLATARLGRKLTPGLRLGTMHRAKGLEFKVVFVVDASARNLPLAAALRAEDPADRETAEEAERRLFYVSLTRARDEAFITYVGEPTPFLKPATPTVSKPSQARPPAPAPKSVSPSRNDLPDVPKPRDPAPVGSPSAVAPEPEAVEPPQPAVRRGPGRPRKDRTVSPSPIELPAEVPDYPILQLGLSQELVSSLLKARVLGTGQLLENLRDQSLRLPRALLSEAGSLLQQLTQISLSEYLQSHNVCPALPANSVPGAFLAVLPQALESLCCELSNPNSWNILSRRMGVRGKSMTLQQLGDALDLSRERVRQIEERALERLGRFLTLRERFSNHVVHPDAARDVANFQAFLTSATPAILSPRELEEWLEREWRVAWRDHEPSLRFLLWALGYDEEDLDLRTGGVAKVWACSDKSTPLKKFQQGYNTLRPHFCEETEAPQEPFELLALLNRKRKASDSTWTEAELERLLDLCPFVEILSDGSAQTAFPFLTRRPLQARRLLREAGEPLSIEAMTRAVNRATLESGARALQPENLGNQLSQDPGVKSLGRSGLWALAEWTHLEDRPIKDVMLRILTRENRPMTLAELHARVSELRPASDRSIQMYLYNEPDFKQVDKERWGLASWSETRGAQTWSADQVAEFVEGYFKKSGPGPVEFRLIRQALENAAGFSQREAQGKLNGCGALRTFRSTEWGPTFATLNSDWRSERRGFARVKKTLRQRVEEELVTMLEEAQHHKLPLGSVIETLEKKLATSPATLYSYIASCPVVEYEEGPNRTKICRLAN